MIWKTEKPAVIEYTFSEEEVIVALKDYLNKNNMDSVGKLSFPIGLLLGTYVGRTLDGKFDGKPFQRLLLTKPLKSEFLNDMNELK